MADITHLPSAKRILQIGLGFIVLLGGVDSLHAKPVIQRSLKKKAKDVHVAVIGDWGTGRAGQRKVFDEVHGIEKRSAYDFLLTVGDNFYPSGVRSTKDAQWKTVFESTYGKLGFPIYPTLGNHDHRGNVQAQIDYSKLSPRWKMPARYYSIVQDLGGDSVLFLALDTELLRQGRDPGQLKWVIEQLRSSKAKWKVVFGHHPIFSHGPHGHNAALKKMLHPVLVETKTDMYIAGHDHTLEIIGPIAGVLHTIAGGGGGSDNPYPIKPGLKTVYGTSGGGFLDLRFSPRKITLQMRPLSGKKPAPYILAKPVR